MNLNTAIGGSLLLGLDNYAFFLFDDAAYTGLRSYHRLHASLPVALGPGLVATPFVNGELRLSLPATPARLDPALVVAAGLDLRLAGSSGGGFLAERPAYLFEAPALHGITNELMLRFGLFGPVNLFARGLLKAVWPAPGQPGVSLAYNDFFRGLERPAEVASFAVFNTELLLAPESLTLSLWETLVLRGFELGAFCDLSGPRPLPWPGGPSPPWASV